jgi:glucose/arabinose dehydrogenase
MRHILIVLATFLYSLLSISAYADSLPLDLIKLPPGFQISVYARVPEARSLAIGKRGIVFVSSRKEGKVYALVDLEKDQRADVVFTIAENLNMPNGIAYRDGSLYVAEVNRILRFDEIETHLEYPPKPVVITESYPTETHHGWKFIAFGPDGMLYVPVGAPCNICEPNANRYALISRIKPDGSGYEVVARGVRNSVGFDWNPQTKELWFTDNGRDLLGDDIPPDELNHVTKTGEQFGYPYCHGRNISDPEYGKKHNCSEFTSPDLEFEAHVAALGMRFYTGKMFPSQYHNQIIVAQHGSWNRSKKIGYRLMSVMLTPNQAPKYEVFAEGWNQGEKVWGRPVDVLVMPDGALLVSDDYSGTIYRISYKASAKTK